MKDMLSPAELKGLLDEAADITVLDVRRRDDRAQVEHPIPGAEWRDPEAIAHWSKALKNTGDILVFCVHGHSVCKNARDFLREQGMSAAALEGGIAAWQTFSRGS
jgi:rhodanese-related sulfurtransferase